MESIRDGRLRRDSQIRGLYEFEKTLGKGHFAIVKLAKHLYTGERVAIKVIDKSKLDEVSRAHLYQEVACMKMVKHQNIVQLYEVIDSSKFLYIVQELGDGGDMYDYLTKYDGGLSEDKARDFFQQIVSAITYCHDLHIVHRDLKPENVVLSRNQDIVKITDFGFSNKYTPGIHLRTSCGSLAYSAPEILLGDSYEAAAVDVWSLGVLLYMLVCGEAPFNEGTDSETLTMIMDCRFKLPHDLSPQCKDLVSNLLRREPADRLSLSQILNHPWMQMVPSPSVSPASGSGSSQMTMSDTIVTTATSSSMPLNNHNTTTTTTTTIHRNNNTLPQSATQFGHATTSAAATRNIYNKHHKTYNQYPVVTREMITEEEHKEIVECMTAQNIADEEAILQSLDTEAYDHISATYFLLAEKRLRLQYDERLKALGGASILGSYAGSSSNSSNNNNVNNNNPPIFASNNNNYNQCQGRRSPQPFSPMQPQHQQQLNRPHFPPNPSNTNNNNNLPSLVTQLSNKSINGGSEQPMITTTTALAPPNSVAANQITPIPLSARSGSNSFAEDPEQMTDISERRNSEVILEKPRTQRSWSAGPGISTTLVQNGLNLSSRDSTSPSPPPYTVVGGCFRNSVESLTCGGVGTPGSSGHKVPHRDHLTIAPSYNRNFLKEDVNKLSEEEQIQRINLLISENDIPNMLLVPSDSVSKSKGVSSSSSTRVSLQSSRLSEPHAGLGKLVEEEGESELDDFEDGVTGPFLGGSRTSRGGQSTGSRFKARNNSLGALFSRKQTQKRRLSAGHSPELMIRNENNNSGSVLTNSGGSCYSSSTGIVVNVTTSRRSTPTRSHYNSDESGGEDTDNRLRVISRFSESDRALGYTFRQHLARHSYNNFSDDSSVERPSLYNSANNSYHYPTPVAGMERNDLSGSTHSTPNNRRQRRKKKSLNEALKMSNLSVSSVVSNLSSKYPIDPTNNTPSDSDSVSSRKTSSYSCNPRMSIEGANDNTDAAVSRLLMVACNSSNSGKHCSSGGLAANLNNLVEEEPNSGNYDESMMVASSLKRLEKVHNSKKHSLSSGGSTGRISLEGKPNVKCEYNKLDNRKPSSVQSRHSLSFPDKKINYDKHSGGPKNEKSRKTNRKTRKKTRKVRIFDSCMKGSADTTSSSVSPEEKRNSKEFVVADCSNLLSYKDVDIHKPPNKTGTKICPCSCSDSNDKGEKKKNNSRGCCRCSKRVKNQNPPNMHKSPGGTQSLHDPNLKSNQTMDDSSSGKVLYDVQPKPISTAESCSGDNIYSTYSSELTPETTGHLASCCGIQ